MEKVPTLFRRGPDHQILTQVMAGCEWVAEGLGYATLKVDGTACMVQNAGLYKRQTLKANPRAVLRAERGYFIKPEDLLNRPEGWIPAQAFVGDGYKWPGWTPVGDGNEDRWHVEGRVNREADEGVMFLPDGTYELVGPKVQGNPYGLQYHTLIPHGIPVEKVWTDEITGAAENPPEGQTRLVIPEIPRTFESLRQFLTDNVIEGIVWWWPRPNSVRMAKIKRRDFGFDWPVEGATLP